MIPALRRLLRRRTPAAPVRRSSPTDTAVLEYEVYGTEPAPGTAAAAYINLRAALGNPVPRGGGDE